MLSGKDLSCDKLYIGHATSFLLCSCQELAVWLKTFFFFLSWLIVENLDIE